MTPRDARLFDVLDLSAQAVDEAASGRPGFAEYAWLRACAAADDLFPAGSILDSAATAVTSAAAAAIGEASRPDPVTEDPVRLWRALEAASRAVEQAAGEDREAAAEALREACDAAVALPRPAARALIAILAGTCVACPRDPGRPLVPLPADGAARDDLEVTA